VLFASCSAFGEEKPSAPLSGQPLPITTTCNGSACTAPSFCCAHEDDDSELCIADGCRASGEAAIRCDSNTDCETGEVCCIRVANYHVLEISCSRACIGEEAYHLCEKASVCGDQPCQSMQTILDGKIYPALNLSACRR
jgi:hypothetical protein